METVEILKAARERISDPKRWTRGTYARDGGGGSINPLSDGAACWCAMGAIQRETGIESDFTEASCLLKQAAGDLREPTEINDGREEGTFADDRRPRYAPARHRDVLALFDRAIELAQKDSRP